MAGAGGGEEGADARRADQTMAHVRQSRPDSGLCFQAKVLNTFQGVSSKLVQVPVAEKMALMRVGEAHEETMASSTMLVVSASISFVITAILVVIPTILFY